MVTPGRTDNHVKAQRGLTTRDTVVPGERLKPTMVKLPPGEGSVRSAKRGQHYLFHKSVFKNKQKRIRHTPKRDDVLRSDAYRRIKNKYIFMFLLHLKLFPLLAGSRVQACVFLNINGQTGKRQDGWMDAYRVCLLYWVVSYAT